MKNRKSEKLIKSCLGAFVACAVMTPYTGFAEIIDAGEMADVTGLACQCVDSGDDCWLELAKCPESTRENNIFLPGEIPDNLLNCENFTGRTNFDLVCDKSTDKNQNCTDNGPSADQDCVEYQPATCDVTSAGFITVSIPVVLPGGVTIPIGGSVSVFKIICKSAAGAANVWKKGTVNVATGTPCTL